MLKMLKNLRGARKGFTLIEILIVVAIIGILASVVLIGLAPAQKRGRDARRLADLKEVQTGLELYYGKCGHYPGTSDDCSTAPAGGDVAWANLTDTLTKGGIGVNQVPHDPSTGSSYKYGIDAGGTSYVLEAVLEQDTSDSKQGLKTNPVPGSSIACGGYNYCVSL
jgi:prepilin-type N-terminal cleavage/methylation domain-containing protein